MQCKQTDVSYLLRASMCALFTKEACGTKLGVIIKANMGHGSVRFVKISPIKSSLKFDVGIFKPGRIMTCA